MRIGMAVDIPKNEEQFQRLRKVVLLLDEAAFNASCGTGLYIQGVPASDFLGAITDQITAAIRRR